MRALWVFVKALWVFLGACGYLKFLARCLISSNTHKIIDLAGQAGNLAGQPKQLEPARAPAGLARQQPAQLSKKTIDLWYHMIA